MGSPGRCLAAAARRTALRSFSDLWPGEAHHLGRRVRGDAVGRPCLAPCLLRLGRREPQHPVRALARIDHVRVLAADAALFAGGQRSRAAPSNSPNRAGDGPLHQGDRATLLRQARRSHRRHLRARAHRPRFAPGPPRSAGSPCRIHPRTLPRAMATERARRGDARADNTPRYTGCGRRNWEPDPQARPGG